MTTPRRASSDQLEPVGPPSGNDAPLSGWVRLVAGALGLGVATAALWWSGQAVPAPSSFDRQGITSWIGTSDPVVAAFALLRLAGLALAGWMALSGGIALVVHLSRLRRIRWLRRLVDRLCLPVVRRLVHGAAGVALAAATLAPGAASALDPATTSIVGARGEVAVLVALEPTAPAPTTLPNLSPPPSRPPNAAADGTLTTARHTWRIEPGQHLWHVAEVTLADHLGVAPDDAAVAEYLTVVIEANRTRLIVPTNPDLVFAGQEIILPPLALGR